MEIQLAYHWSAPPPRLSELLLTFSCAKKHLRRAFILAVRSLPWMSPIPQMPSWRKPQSHRTFHDCTISARGFSLLTVMTDTIETRIATYGKSTSCTVKMNSAHDTKSIYFLTLALRKRACTSPALSLLPEGEA